MATEERLKLKNKLKKRIKQEIKKLFKKLECNEAINGNEYKLFRYVFNRLTTEGYEGQVEYFDEFACEVMRELRLS